MLVLCLGLGLALEDREFRKPLPLACLGAAALGLTLTFTRSAWLGALTGGGALLFLKRPKAAALLCAVFALSLLIPANPIRERLAQGFDMTQDSTRERVYMAEAGSGIIRDHPLFGVGDAMESWDGHLGYYRRYMPEDEKGIDNFKQTERGHLHDNFVQVSAMYGVPALILLLAFFGRCVVDLRALVRSVRPLKRGLGWGMGACLVAWWVNGLFEYNLGSFQSTFTLWALLGLAFAAVRLPEES
jgi:O-antigen ligase